MICRKPAYELRVPKLGGNTKVFAATHQGIGFAALNRRWELFGAEVAVFALGLSHKPSLNQRYGLT
jgi:hypothetical protein